MDSLTSTDSTKTDDVQASSIRLQAPELESKQRLAAKLLTLTPLHKLPPKLFRPVYSAMDRLLGLSKIEIAKVIDSSIAITSQPHKTSAKTIKLRAYYPVFQKADGVDKVKTAQKTLVYFHGGGCVIGSIDTHDRFCRFLANHGKMNVISVNYRLAPEHKFPSPICDAIEAWNHVNENHQQLHINPNHIGVGGDSAGAYLACIIGLTHVQNELPVIAKTQPEFQFLIYPMLDLQGLTESYRKFDKQLILTRTLMDYFRDHYLNSLNEISQPLVSPLLIKDISQSPKTYLLTLGYDPLRDDGITYATRLKNAEVITHHQHFDDCMHGFISITKTSDRAKQACHQIAMALNKFNDE
ncbi:alpha/beta hydrolase [uncultured Shewanella sp.]|uniref:alpha/beta hydrolase n=1 Tax=uncultured Shewanella sp. TaxID=173975 RepID=UPI0026060C8A|nr:alpha/beta hydrolase [uncultured Shewanella sp.]